MLARELEAKYIIHYMSIIDASANWYPWVAQVNLSFNGMKKLAECVNPESIAPRDGSGVLQDRLG